MESTYIAMVKKEDAILVLEQIIDFIRMVDQIDSFKFRVDYETMDVPNEYSWATIPNGWSNIQITARVFKDTLKDTYV